MESEDPRRRLEAQLKVSDDYMRITVDRDFSAMATNVRGSLEAALADKVAKYAVESIARRAAITPDILCELIEFLVADPEIGSRFTAHMAAKRILREPNYEPNYRR